MARPLKIALFILAAFILLVIAGVVAVATLVDPNDYTPTIEASVRESTGRELSIGDVRLSYFPTLGIELSDVALGNAPGFDEGPFARMGSAKAGVALLPLLLHRQLSVRHIELDGVEAHLQRRADGSDNWSDLTRSLASRDPEARADRTPAPDGSTIDLQGLDVAGISVRNATLSLDDAQAGRHWTASGLNLETGALQPGQPYDLKLDTNLAEPARELSATLSATATVVPAGDDGIAQVRDIEVRLNSHPENLTIDALATADLRLDRAARRYVAPDFELQVTAIGPDMPGGRQDLRLHAQAVYDAEQAKAQLDQLDLQVAGVRAGGSLVATGVGSDSLQIKGPLAIQAFDARALMAQFGKTPLETEDATALTKVALQGQLVAGANAVALEELRLDIDDSVFAGRVALADIAARALRFKLAAQAFDADRYLPPFHSPDPAKRQPDREDSPMDQARIPVERFEKLDVVGEVSVAALRLRHLDINDARVSIDGPGGEPKRIDVTGNLYGGSGKIGLALTPSATPSATLKGQFAGVQLEPLLQAASGEAKLRGTGNVGFDLAAAGDTLAAMRRDLDGTLSLSLRDGAVKGVNVGGLLRRSQASLRGQSAASDANEVKETDFAELSVSGVIKDGVLTSKDLDAASPLLRMTGAGNVNLVDRSLDYEARPTIVETSRGQGGKDLENLRGLTIPLRISGSWDQPSIRLQIDDALREQAKTRLKSELREHEDEIKERVGGALERLLGKRRKKQEEDTGDTTNDNGGTR